MEKPRVNFEKYVSIMENSHSNKAVILPYIKGSNIIDFGAGSGKLAEMIKAINPNSTIIAVDNDPEMGKLLRESDSVDVFSSSLFDVSEPVDTIIFNSVLHEVESYATFPTKLNKHPKTVVGNNEILYSERYIEGDLIDLLIDANTLLKAGGRIIIRDGFLDTFNDEISVRIKNDQEDFPIDRYIYDYTYQKSLTQVGNRVVGKFNEVKEFLNKLTWGKESLDREILEKVNTFSEKQWREILIEAGFEIIEMKTYMQPSYFAYLQQKVDLDRVWDTHILIVAEKK